MDSKREKQEQEQLKSDFWLLTRINNLTESSMKQVTEVDLLTEKRYKESVIDLTKLKCPKTQLKRA